jgi:hypothetical protein
MLPLECLSARRHPGMPSFPIPSRAAQCIRPTDFASSVGPDFSSTYCTAKKKHKVKKIFLARPPFCGYSKDMNKLNYQKRCEVITALVEGCSINATCRMTGVSKNTVLGFWLVSWFEKSSVDRA